MTPAASRAAATSRRRRACSSGDRGPGLRLGQPAFRGARDRSRRRGSPRDPLARGGRRRRGAGDPRRRTLRDMHAGALPSRVRRLDPQLRGDGSAGLRCVRGDADPVRGERGGPRGGTRGVPRTVDAATRRREGAAHGMEHGHVDSRSPLCPWHPGRHPSLLRALVRASGRRRVTVGVTEHGLPFSAAVSRGRVFATQFHPEKSGEAGLQIYRRFVESVVQR